MTFPMLSYNLAKNIRSPPFAHRRLSRLFHRRRLTNEAENYLGNGGALPSYANAAIFPHVVASFRRDTQPYLPQLDRDAFHWENKNVREEFPAERAGSPADVTCREWILLRQLRGLDFATGVQSAYFRLPSSIVKWEIAKYTNRMYRE